LIIKCIDYQSILHTSVGTHTVSVPLTSTISKFKI